MTSVRVALLFMMCLNSCRCQQNERCVLPELDDTVNLLQVRNHGDEKALSLYEKKLSLLDALWDGQDISEEEENGLLTEQDIAEHNWHDAGEKGKGLRTASKGCDELPCWTLLGPMDSGTNLFFALAEKTFPQMPHWRQSIPIWKHSIASAEAISEAYAKNMPSNDLKQLVLVVTVRSPIAQIASWKKAPYDLTSCAERAYTHMDEPCQMVRITGNEPQSLSSVPPHSSFTSTMDVYNTYLAHYQELKASGKFKDVFVVTYEDMVLDPDEVMAKFAAIFNVSPPRQVPTISKPAKGHGNPVGREAALQKLKTRPWLDEVGRSGLATLCGGLNETLMANIIEGTYRTQDKQRPYSQDCSNL